MNRLEEICLKYTKLQIGDIRKLQELEEFLPLISKVTNGDVFIDCLTKDGRVAVVVAEHLKEASSYRETVVGKLAYKEKEPAVLRTLNTGVTTNQLYGVSQENFPIEQTTVAIKNKGKIIGVLIVEQVALDAKPSLEKLVGSEAARLGNPVEAITMPEIYLVFDRKGDLIDYNLGAKKFYTDLGYHEIRGQAYDNLSLEEISLEEIRAKKYIRSKEVLIGGRYVDIQYSALPSEDRLTLIISDMTDMRNQKQELINKSLALHEVHHRIKNNLQTLASLLRLQLRRSDDEKIQTVFQESIHRILSIAAIHEILSKDPSGQVEIKQLSKRLMASIIQNSIYDHKQIKARVLGQDLLLDSQTAIFVALVLNELISNAYYHAFENRDQGVIRVKVEKAGARSRIFVIDDGQGFKKEDIKSDSLGLSIVEGLVKETLKGDLVIESSGLGTKVMLEI